MLTQIKVYILIALFVGSNGFVGYTTYKCVTNKYKAKALAHQVELTKRDNATKVLQEVHTREIEKVVNDARTKALSIKPLIIKPTKTPSCDAYLNDIDRLRDELIDTIPEMFLESNES